MSTGRRSTRAVRPRPVLLALAPAPAGSPASSIPALADLGGISLARRLLDTLAPLSLPAPVVLTATAAAGRMRSALGPEVMVLPSSGRRLAALAAALPSIHEDAVMILDSERALTPSSVIQEVLAGLDEHTDAVVPVIPLTDSVKAASPGGLRNVDRSTLATMQSPRLLRRTILEQAVTEDGRSGAEGPDDEILAALDQGARVRTVHGSHAGFAVVDRLRLWEAQISLGLPRDTSHRHGRSRRG